MSLIVGTNTWGTLEEADSYLATRLGAEVLWNAELKNPRKESALVTAYHQLNDCGLFDFPATATSAIKRAQYEMAYFLLMHQDDIDRRMGLQSQNVAGAQIVGETYRKEEMPSIPIPNIVKNILETYKTRKTLGVTAIYRDDDEALG